MGRRTGAARRGAETAMADHVYNLYEAKSALSRLVDEAAAGDEIIIAKAGRPMAKLVPLTGAGRERCPGAWKGRMRIGDDFDAPLPPEIEAAFQGRGDGGES